MKKESITVSIPAFNEEQTLEKVVDEALSVLKLLTRDYELLLINDGSTDQTSSIMNRLAKKHKRIRLIEHSSNEGFSSVITKGLLNPSKDLVFLGPADGQFDFKHLPKFVRKIQKFDAVIAYRTSNAEPVHRKIQSRFYHKLSKLLFGIRLKEFSSVYLWRTSALKGIQINSAPKSNTAQIEIMYKAQKRGAKMTQIPIRWRARRGGEPKGRINPLLIFLTLRDIAKLYYTERVQDILTNFPYHFTEITVKILTFNLFLIKRLIVPFTNRGNIVLDLGCGIGTMAEIFPKNNYIGVDINPKAIEIARQKHHQHKFEVADVTKFNTEKKFDLVLIIGVLHHLSDNDVSKTLKRVSSCVKNGGKVVIIEAIPPLFKLNIFGYFLRAHDKGNFIRKTEEYKFLTEKWLTLDRCESRFGGFFDYAYLTATIKQ